MGPSGAMKHAPTVQVNDASGKFLIPGLWDMHTHPHEEISPLFVANGVTGVRIMGGAAITGGLPEFVRRRVEIAEGKRLGPRLIVASPTLYGYVVHHPEEGRTAVRDAIQKGADFIKVYDNLSADSYYAIADEANKLGVPFVGHVPNPPGLEACAKAGQKSVEHMMGVHSYLQRVIGGDSGRISFGVQDLNASQASTFFDVFRKNRMWLCPTLTASFGLSGDPRLSQDPRLRYCEKTTKARWARIFQNPNLVKARQRYECNLGLVGAMHKAGVGILAGTDTTMVGEAPGSAPYCLPGFGLHDELQHMVAAGLSPMDALRAATYKPAEFLGLLDSLGTVEKGKLAELVLLDANPLSDIANTSRISMVFTGGRVYRRSALDALLNAAEASAKD